MSSPFRERYPAARFRAGCDRRWPTSRASRPGSPSRELLQSLGDDDSRCSLDESEVGERLREVAQVSTGVDVELLGEKPERRGDPKQLLHQVTGLLVLADDG